MTTDVPTDETSSLISADKVSGTDVYNTAGDSLGEILDVMIDKQSGKIAYAVMSFGGFLGIGERYHPLPWSALKYDTRQGGYVVGLTKGELQGAPTFGPDETPAWGDRAYEKGSTIITGHSRIGDSRRCASISASGTMNNNFRADVDAVPTILNVVCPEHSRVPPVAPSSRRYR